MRFSLRTLAVACVLLCIVLTYAGGYYRLSRRGMREAAEYELNGFFYVPIEEVFRTQDLCEQRRYAVFYAPANVVDRALFGNSGRIPITSVLWSLSG
jgi:hypothetical protein